jgi:bacillithiol system protein YtxJ
MWFRKREAGVDENGRSPTRFLPIASELELEGCFRRPGVQLLFLHDPWCPLSSHAEHELGQLGLDVRVVDVSVHRSLSARVQHHTGVRHQSPQLIVLRDGQPVWDASHFRISRKALVQTLSSVLAPGGG